MDRTERTFLHTLPLLSPSFSGSISLSFWPFSPIAAAVERPLSLPPAALQCVRGKLSAGDAGPAFMRGDLHRHHTTNFYLKNPEKATYLPHYNV